ncbi:ABC transporter ATP-binding protein [candidate division KSB1 bacterium]|nr:ABC transporter ATP-binding protein [candidate division KSB1 bacterium]
MTFPVSIQNLKKSYAAVPAVQNVSIQVQKGEIYGLIGPDGAGKTTIIRILVSLLDADGGEVLFMGRNVSQNVRYVRSNIGYMPQRFSLYRDLSVRQNLRFFGDLFHVPRHIQEQRLKALYDFSKLGPFQNRLAGALSGGMKQKLALSCMLMHEPDVIVLDEPTFGVDPVSRAEFWDILKMLASNGKCLLVSTAYMDEAYLCHRIGLLDKGRLLAQNKPQVLIERFDFPLYRIRSEQPHKIYTQLKATYFEKHIQLFGDGVYFIDRDKSGSAAIRRRLADLNITYDKFEPVKPTLENLFLELMI